MCVCVGGGGVRGRGGSGEEKLVIAKTSGKLCPNQYRNGAGIVWRDRIQAINQASKTTATVQLFVPGCTNSHNCSDVAFWLGISACPAPH